MVADPEVLHVVYPVKRVEMRVTGLDDALTVAYVVEAVAKERGCLAIEVGQLRRIVVGRKGHGSNWLSLPIATANKLSSASYRHGERRQRWCS